MENSVLTNRSFWLEYWHNYNYSKVADKMIYDDFIPKNLENKTFLEIGGFPGIHSVYFKKKGCVEVSLLDFYIDKGIIHQVEESNDLPTGTIECIEADFLAYKGLHSFDIVFSYGFVEHFEDTKEIIENHLRLLKKGGTLLLTIPNFRGINGSIQYLTDKQNLLAHNLNSMKIENLKKIMNSLDVNSIVVEYTSMPMVWVEPKPGIVNFVIRKLVRVLSSFLKLFPFKCRLLSPYIVIKAVKC